MKYLFKKGKSVTLEDFILEERKRVALFQAYWKKNADLGETFDGDPVWPLEMTDGSWDEHLMTFDLADAEKMGMRAELIDGDWVVTCADQDPTPLP